MSPDFNRSLNIITGDTCLESTCRCGSQSSILFWSKVVYLFPLKAECTLATSETGDIKNWTQQLGRRKKKIYQTSFVLNTIENFSAVCAADNSPRLWKNKSFVIMHFQVIFQFLNISKEQYNIFLNWLTFAQCLSPFLRSGSTLPLEIQNFLSWSFSACPLELSDCGVWSKTEGIHTASRK